MSTQNGTTQAAPVSAPSATPTPAPSPEVKGGAAEKSPKSGTKAERTARALAKIAEAHVEKAAPPLDAPETPKTPEATPPVETKTAKSEPDAPKVSKKILELQGREASLTKKEGEIQQRENDIKAREAKLSKDNPLGVLQALGLSFTDLADAVIADSKIPESVKKQMKDQADALDAVKKTLSDEEQRKKDAEDKAKEAHYETTVKTFKANLNGFLETNKATYELIDVNGAQDLVYDTMVQYYEEHGSLPAAKDAAEQVEKFLEDRYRRMAAATKFKPKEPESAPAKEPKSPSTLTNSMSAGSPSRTDKTVPMSRTERLAKAASKIKWDS